MSSKTNKLDSFKNKIKTLDEVVKIVGARPRNKTTVFCHGTFDIVHPGHLRHLMYAKERADILVACLVCDSYILKSKLRPSVPEEIRAINLAALEFVDYVVIDENESPLDYIKKLQPDYYAKGFDYFEAGPSKASEEISAVEAYGGEVLFTPGDAESSSSLIAETLSPRLGAAKLVLLMDSEGITFEDLYATIDKFKNIKVHVVGDTIVDSYTYCRAQGGVSKTPTMSVQFEKQIDFAGGAAIVSRHMRKAGAAEVTLSTVLGDDELKDFVLSQLKDSDVVSKAVIDRTRPTIQKNTFIAGGYHMLRVGKVDNRIVSNKIQDKLLTSIRDSKADIIVFSDFRHGIFNRTTIPSFLESVPKNAIKVADSQVASRWGNILEFQGCDLITPNEKEVRFALGDQDSVVRPLAHELYSRANCKCLIMTMGDRGILTYRGAGEKRQFFIVDSFVDHVVDAVGAGDALLSYASLALHASKSEVIASILGSAAAAIACEREGNIPVSPDEVVAKLSAIEKMTELSRELISKVVIK